MNLRTKTMLVAMSLCVMNFATPSDRGTKIGYKEMSLATTAALVTTMVATYSYQSYTRVKQEALAAARVADRAEAERAAAIPAAARATARVAAERAAAERAAAIIAEVQAAQREADRAEAEAAEAVVQAAERAAAARAATIAEVQEAERAANRAILFQRRAPQQQPQTRAAVEEERTCNKTMLTSVIEDLQPKRLPANFDKNEQCTICIEELNSGTIVQTPCNHLFHQRCMINLLNEAPQGDDQSHIKFILCPNCQKPILDLGKWNNSLQMRTGPFVLRGSMQAFSHAPRSGVA